MKNRLSTALEDPRFIRLLKLEAQETGSTMKKVLTRALEAYFAHRLETKALNKVSESVFAEWNNPKDSDYDSL